MPHRALPGQLIVALGEYDTGWHDPAASLARARALARRAAEAGAQVLVLPEMCATGFTMEAGTYAEEADGSSARALAAVAAEHRLWLVAGLALRREGRFVNTAMTFAPTGALHASYDKQRLFGYARETDIYSGGSGNCVVRIDGLTVALFVCFDLRFPELFRAVGPEVDACIVVANWPSARQAHWDTLIRARAIENQCYVVAVNRIGTGDGLGYAGGSRIYDPWGERADAAAPGGGVRIGTLARETVDRVRRDFPVTDDRRARTT